MEQPRSKEMVKELPIEGLFLKEMTNKEIKKNYLMKGQNSANLQNTLHLLDVNQLHQLRPPKKPPPRAVK